MLLWDSKFEIEFGQTRICLAITCMSLAEKLLFIFLKIRDQSSIQRQNHACSLAIGYGKGELGNRLYDQVQK